TLANEGLQQILDAICHHSSLPLPLLGRWIAPLELRCEHLLRCHARLMERDPAIRADGVLAQLRASTASAVERDEHLAALRRDLHAEAGVSGVPIDSV